MLIHAKSSIRSTNVELRDISSRTLNIKKSSIPQLKQAIREFRDKVSDLFEEAERGDETYQINIQLFPLTNRSK